MKAKLLKLLLPIIVIMVLLSACRAKQTQQTQAPAQQTEQTSVQQSLKENDSIQETVAFQTQPADEETQESITEEAETVHEKTEAAEQETVSGVQVEEDGYYTSKEEVAAYLHRFGRLPDNYITKNQARKNGWVQSEGNLDEVLPGMSIGGGPFGNNEGKLPEAPGREYHECDIDYRGGRRNAKRIIYSNDGLIFYTGDHYETFEQLY